MNSITIGIISTILALIGAFNNPMNWTYNFKGEVTISIYIYAFLMIVGLIGLGYALGKQIYINGEN